MADLEKALATQLANIEKRTGRSLAQLTEIVKTSGLAKHGEIRDMLKRELGLGHGDANTLVHYALKSDTASAVAESGATVEEMVAGYYGGAKAALRPIHDAIMAAIGGFGPFEIAPKKTYLSLRRKKQFAMVGPATNSRIEVGLNLKSPPAATRLIENPPKSMCTHKVKIESAGDVDAELIAWIKRAFDEAG